MINIRALQSQDIESLYAISLATGAIGKDASSLYRDGRLIGHIYVGPYAVLTPSNCFVAEQGDEIVGFVVGTLDTASFERRLEDEWWPKLRDQYPDPDIKHSNSWNMDQKRSFMIHHPNRTPDEILAVYPSHVHLNLLPKAQRKGIGTSLINSWLSHAEELGSCGVHVGVNAQNQNARLFWQAQSFSDLDDLIVDTKIKTLWLGRKLHS
ncbi:MAG: GNAT family N-acetyltransferase [Hyphomicrobiales bacterium]|nr:MAG: GNAT family N-acetyltransferase [Hyphomicrobiales bacterium]